MRSEKHYVLSYFCQLSVKIVNCQTHVRVKKNCLRNYQHRIVLDLINLTLTKAGKRRTVRRTSSSFVSANLVWDGFCERTEPSEQRRAAIKQHLMLCRGVRTQCAIMHTRQSCVKKWVKTHTHTHKDTHVLKGEEKTKDSRVTIVSRGSTKWPYIGPRCFIWRIFFLH